MTPIPSPQGHPDPHEVTAYLSGTADRAARARFEAHLADCADCAEELVAVRRLHRRPPPMSRRFAVAGAAAAAVIAVALVGHRVGGPPVPTTPPVRGDGSAAAVTTVSPQEGAAIEPSQTFAWRPVAGATSYRISITLADGDSVWAASVADTAVRAPEQALTGGSGTYFWYVDALLADGRSVAGTAHEFRLSR
jgi:putative zinc finger protein